MCPLPLRERAARTVRRTHLGEGSPPRQKSARGKRPLIRRHSRCEASAFSRTAAEGRLCHLLPQGEKGKQRPHLYFFFWPISGCHAASLRLGAAALVLILSFFGFLVSRLLRCCPLAMTSSPPGFRVRPRTRSALQWSLGMTTRRLRPSH